MAHITVTINGKSYRLACEDGQDEHLRRLADRVDTTISTLKTTFGEIGDQRITVMASIMLADELYDCQLRLRGLEAEYTTMRELANRETLKKQTEEKQIISALNRACETIENIDQRLASRKSADVSENGEQDDNIQDNDAS